MLNMGNILLLTLVQLVLSKSKLTETRLVHNKSTGSHSLKREEFLSKFTYGFSHHRSTEYFPQWRESPIIGLTECTMMFRN